MKTSTIGKAITALALISSSLQASVVLYEFDGSTDTPVPHPNIGGTDIYPGLTPFAGHFTYDTGAAQISGNATEAFYPLIDLHITFNPSTVPETVVITGGEIHLINDPTLGDHFNINGGVGQAPTNTSLNGFNIDFHRISLLYFDNSGTALSSTALPGASLTEADFPPSGSYGFEYSDPGDSNTFGHDGTLDNLRSSSVPEPSSTGLVLGAIALGLIRRRR